MTTVPPHRHARQPWSQSARGGTRDDRTLREITVSLPPRIATVDLAVPAGLQASTEEALREIAALDETHGAHLGSLSTLLLRAESVASSKIEYVEASVDDYARALHGVRSNSSATSMVASTVALVDLVGSVADGQPIQEEAVLRAHRALMAADPTEQSYAGRIRDVQNWIGGSDHSPRNALYVPPPPPALADGMSDLIKFANRTDLPVLAQAAVAHAQFESIHPFTDGNGRIGRALINTILRRRGSTRRTVVPLASAIVARRDDYFRALETYREGDAGPILTMFVQGSTIVARESGVTADRLAQLPERWHEAAGGPRRGSATERILAVLLDHPIFAAEDAVDLVGGAASSVYSAINRLHGAGVIRPLTKRVRNQIWIASEIADELDDLGHRIAAKARDAGPSHLTRTQ